MLAWYKLSKFKLIKFNYRFYKGIAGSLAALQALGDIINSMIYQEIYR